MGSADATHEIEQEVLTPQGEKLKFISEAWGEDDCLYDTKVTLNGEQIGIISGDSILKFVAELWKGYAKSYHTEHYTAKKVIENYLI